MNDFEMTVLSFKKNCNGATQFLKRDQDVGVLESLSGPETLTQQPSTSHLVLRKCDVSPKDFVLL